MLLTTTATVVLDSLQLLPLPTMDGRHHPRRNPSFDAGDEQFFNYGSTVDYGGYSHRRGQHSNASAYDRPPRTPEHAEYDYSQYAAARLALSPHFGEGYDSETRYYPDGVHHAQRPSVSQSINSYSSNVPSPPPHREYPPVPPPHRSQPSFRQHQSQFPITDTISERPAEELSSLHHTPSQASGYQPRALPPTPDDPVEEKDNDFDSVLDNISWMPSPPPRSITSGSVEDPELVLYRPSSSHLNDRDASLRSIDPISRHGSSGRASINRNYSSASRVYDNRSSGTMMAAEEPAAPFTISGYAPEDEEETPADYGDTDDSLLDAYDDMSILSPPPLVTRPPQANNPSPTAPSVHLDFGNPQSNQHENMRDAEPAVNIGFLDYYDDLENFVRPLPIPPGRSLSATTRPTLPRPEAAIPRRRTNASGIPSRERHSLIETSTSPLLSFDLPAIPFGRQGQLEPSRVSKTQFDQCTEPWALSSVVTWLKSLASKVTEVSRGGLVKILILLYQYKVPTTALLEIEELAEDIVDRMLASGVLEGEEQELRFTSVSLSGVLPQFTGSGCYSLNSHVSSNKAMAHKRCYSSLCGRQKRHALLYTNFDLLWHEHYKIDMAEIPPNEVRFQNTVRDLLRFVYTIWDLVDFLNNVVTLYLRERDPCLTLSMEKEQAGKFVQDVFGHFPDTAKALKEYLLLPLREREAQQGPYVKKISDILLRFIKRSRTAFLNDIAARGRANFLFSRQREIDGRFRKFATNVLRKDKIGWEQMVATTVKFTTGCLATLDALAKTCPDPEEKAQIQVAIQEWNELTKQINAKQAESEHTGHPRALASMLTISNKVPFEKEHLLLQERMRQVLFQNDLNRQSSSTVKFGQMTRIKGILLDNYMLFAKQKFLRGNDENTSSTAFDYIVDRLPIPMRMLALEWPNDDVVFKNTRASNPATRSQSHHLVTISGMPTAGQTPPISTTVESQDRSYFPFTIKHLGKESHEVFASSKILRQSWCNHIKQALQNHVKAARSTEPFRLRVLADNSFVYSQDQSSSARRLHVEGTALWDALREVEAKYPESRSRGSPVARGNCLCSTVFTDNDGALRIYIGTTSGLYISDYDNPRGWQKVCIATPG